MYVREQFPDFALPRSQLAPGARARNRIDPYHCQWISRRRASVAERAAFSRPSIFIAGNYVADESLGPRLAVFPHWLHVEVIVEGRQLSLQAAGAKLLLKRETLTADDFPAIRSARVHRRAAANGCSIDYIFGLSGNVVLDRFAGREAGMIKAD